MQRNSGKEQNGKRLEISSSKLEIPREHFMQNGLDKGVDLTKAEILRRGGKNTQKNCSKKIFTTKIIMML